MSIPSSTLRAPIYFIIQQKILEQIQQGALQPGQQLPTEAELAQQYQVSRITAKRALDELVRLGRAYRQQGKGTFVAQTRIRETSGFGSFSADMRARGLVPASQILTFSETEPPIDVQQRLKLVPGERTFFLKRLRLASGEPVAVESAYLPSKVCPDLIHEDLNSQSLYAVLADKFQIVPTWADAEIEAVMPTKEEIAFLKLPAGMPVLTAHRITFSANYEIIETADSVYRGDRFTFYSGRQRIE
jgi:GntR family transcriptional regulator